MCSGDRTYRVGRLDDDEPDSPVVAPTALAPVVDALLEALGDGELDRVLRGAAVASVPLQDADSIERVVPILRILDDAGSVDFDPTRSGAVMRWCPARGRLARVFMAIIADPAWLIAWSLTITRHGDEAWVYRDETWVVAPAPESSGHLASVPTLLRLREPFLSTLWTDDGAGPFATALTDVEVGRLRPLTSP